MDYQKFLKDMGIGYVSLLIILFFSQNYFVYHPDRFEAYDLPTLKDLNVNIVSERGLKWPVMPAGKGAKRVLVWFHGNAGIALARREKAELWRKAGYHVVLAEYPGYGTNQGTPNENDFYQVARIILDKTRADFPDADLYLYGESIGSGVAVQMATEYDEKGLIIESGFSSLVDVAFAKLPIVPMHLLLQSRFDNADKINKIGSPLMMVHGGKDYTVPLRFGQRLFAAYDGEKEFVLVDEGNHNNIYTVMDVTTDLIQKVK